VANLQHWYSVASANLRSFLKHFDAQLDEDRTTAKRKKRDQTAKEDNSSKIFDKIDRQQLPGCS